MTIESPGRESLPPAAATRSYYHGYKIAHPFDRSRNRGLEKGKDLLTVTWPVSNWEPKRLGAWQTRCDWLVSAPGPGTHPTIPNSDLLPFRYSES